LCRHYFNAARNSSQGDCAFVDCFLESVELGDLDGDGIGNNADPDDDNDGVPDAEDDYPLGRFSDAGPGY
jgi:hypothetical protein